MSELTYEEKFLEIAEGLEDNGMSMFALGDLPERDVFLIKKVSRRRAENFLLSDTRLNEFHYIEPINSYMIASLPANDIYQKQIELNEYEKEGMVTAISKNKLNDEVLNQIVDYDLKFFLIIVSNELDVVSSRLFLSDKVGKVLIKSQLVRSDEVLYAAK